MCVDLRDMSGATWRDVVAGVLEDCREAVPLTYLYEKIAPYKKARTNSHWKEKIRQTLQLYPQYFRSTEKGFWVLSGAQSII